jgi:hypothetical protein
VSLADTPEIHYNTPPPFDNEDNLGTNESVHENLNAKVTTPRNQAVVPAEGPSPAQDIDIDDEEQGLFIDLERCQGVWRTLGLEIFIYFSR